MKFFRPLFLFFIVINHCCKTDKKEVPDLAVVESTILQKIANAHGFEHWKKVNQIEFTFNVDRDSTHFERSWIWKPKSNDVTRISGTDTLFVKRHSLHKLKIRLYTKLVSNLVDSCLFLRFL